jgi:hypothetical protein
MPQPGPRLIDRLGHIAAQLGGQPGDQHRVFLIGLIAGQVLGPPRPRSDHRLHAHERHRPARRQLRKHPPSVPGRLARHRHPRPPMHGSAPGRPVQRRAKIPGAAPERPPRDHLRVMIGHHDHLLAARQIDPGDRVRHRHQAAQPLQASIAVAVTTGHATTVTHERPPAAWDTKPEAHQGDVPTSPTDTQNVFLCRDEVRRDDHPSASGEVRLRGARGPALCARRAVADARGADTAAHPRLALIAERGRLASDSRARSRLDLDGSPAHGHRRACRADPGFDAGLPRRKRVSHIGNPRENAASRWVWAAARPARRAARIAFPRPWCSSWGVT